MEFGEGEYITPEDAAGELNITVPLFWRLARNEGLPTVMIGKRRKVPRQAFGEWQSSHSELLARMLSLPPLDKE